MEKKPGRLLSKVLLIASLWLMAHSGLSLAQVELVKFDDPAKEEVYRDLIDELRCLVCANQSLSGSNSALATDLRRKVREMLGEDKSREDIVDYMVERYGEYVLYNPPLSARTIVLWTAPIVVLLVALALAIRSRSRQQQTVAIEIDESEREKARALLSSTSDRTQTPGSR